MTGLEKMICASSVGFVLFAGAMGLASTRADSVTLSDNEKSYVIAITASVLMTSECSADVVEGSATTLADRLSVDRATLNRAIMATIHSRSGVFYDPKDLIPEVSTTVWQTQSEINSGLMLNRIKTCFMWTLGLRILGVVQ